MEMPFYVADNHEYNWSDKILTQLTLQRHAARYNDKQLYESISKERESFDQTKDASQHKRKSFSLRPKRKLTTSWKHNCYHLICWTRTQKLKICVIRDGNCSQNQCSNIFQPPLTLSLGPTMPKTWIFFCIKFDILSKKDDSGQRCW